MRSGGAGDDAAVIGPPAGDAREAARVPLRNAAGRWRSVIDVVRDRAQRHPDEPAFTRLARGEEPQAALSYGELERRARAIAARLQDRVPAGTPVLLVFSNETAFVATIMGCLFAGLVAVPAAPPRNAQGVMRLHRLAEAAGARLAIASGQLRGRIRKLEQGAGAARFSWIFADELPDGPEEAWREPPSGPDAIAILQFTSGSTGAQKGVMVSQRNILHNCGLLESVCGTGRDARMVSWLPFFHDWGLIGCLMFPVYTGGSCAFFDPAEFLQRPRRWLEAIDRFGARVSCAPNFAYETCVRAPDDGSPLDLSGWRMAMVGAEPVRRDTLDRFAAAYAPHGFGREAFYPCYGLAESTLIVTGGRRPAPPVHVALDRAALEAGRAAPAVDGSPDARVFVGCGRPLGDQEVLIADPETGRPCAPMEIGEIRISGPSVAQGYIGRPDETRRTFAAEDGSGRRWLRSGDLGVLIGGELFICGRLKDIIIKAGANHFAEELEHSAGRSHPALRPGCGAAFGVEVDGTERLVVVHEIGYGRKPAELQAVVSAIQMAVSEDHGVLADAIGILRPGTLEKTSSGKIRRRHTRSLFLAGQLDTLKLWKAW